MSDTSTSLESAINPEITAPIEDAVVVEGAPAGETTLPAEETPPSEETVATNTSEEAPADAGDKPSEPAAGTVEKEPVMVPLAVVQELRQEIRGLKQSDEVKEEPVAFPDPVEDPEGYTNALRAEQSREILTVRLDISHEAAVAMHGQEAVNKAFDALKNANDPESYKKIMAAKMPYSALVDWHKKHQVSSEIGDDPEAWKAAQREAIRKELLEEANSQDVKDKAGKPAPSLASLNGTGGGPKSAPVAGPTPLEDVFPD